MTEDLLEYHLEKSVGELLSGQISKENLVIVFGKIFKVIIVETTEGSSAGVLNDFPENIVSLEY